MYEENLLEAILIKKDASARTFLRKMNYAYDFQKKDIESYYRERKKDAWLKYRQRLRATQNARRMRTNERDKDRDIPK